MSLPIALRASVAGDAERVAQILIDVRSAFMPYAPLVHTPDEVRRWVRTFLVPSPGTVVAERNGEVVAVMATEREPACSWIMQMAVDPPHAGIGIGSTLLEHAIAVLPSPIRLYTFQANAGARRFYERHGFRAIELTDGQDNEERCPDVLYEFVAEGTAFRVSSPPARHRFVTATDAQMPDVVSPETIAASLTEHWSPRVIAELDDCFVKVAKVRGSLAWHSHDGEDELFYILKGSLRIEMEERVAVLNEGDLFVVPKGVRHNPVAEHECLILLVERKTTLHTGSEITDRTRSIAEQMRPLV